MDALAALRLQMEWGADEALGSRPLHRFRAVAAIEPPQIAVQIETGPVPALALRRAVPAAPALSGAPLVARAQALAVTAGTVEELEAALAGFDGCALAATATSLVFGAGGTTASMMLIGDVPGADEDRLGLPFAGQHGQLLDRMLGSIGLSMASIRTALVVPWRPPGGRQPTAAEVAICLPFLQRHIALVRPLRLLTVGSLPFRALLGEAASAARSRGHWTNVQIPGVQETIPALPLVHPQQLVSRPEQKPLMWQGLRQLRRGIDRDNV